MSELQIQRDLSGKIQSMTFTGERKKPKSYTEQKKTGLFRYEGEDKP